ncbi:ferredoxin [Synechococcus sp. CC9605]|uniref:ferredoxin n=1 Tax=Synechococcus sp. (strain CC9605) TaxID=110662 RepID=UPI0027E2F29F|nr:ferredoxin [Synechococcus sp. CC9605]
MTDAPASDEFRINERCIDCGTCWTFDPDHFAAGAGTAVVAHQPRGASSQRQALLALQACPVAAIETSRACNAPHRLTASRAGSAATPPVRCSIAAGRPNAVSVPAAGLFNAPMATSWSTFPGGVPPGPADPGDGRTGSDRAHASG